MICRGNMGERGQPSIPQAGGVGWLAMCLPDAPPLFTGGESRGETPRNSKTLSIASLLPTARHTQTIAINPAGSAFCAPGWMIQVSEDESTAASYAFCCFQAAFIRFTESWREGARYSSQKWGERWRVKMLVQADPQHISSCVSLVQSPELSLLQADGACSLARSLAAELWHRDRHQCCGCIFSKSFCQPSTQFPCRPSAQPWAVVPDGGWT